jgi:hypothetical protein
LIREIVGFIWFDEKNANVATVARKGRKIAARCVFEGFDKFVIELVLE